MVAPRLHHVRRDTMKEYTDGTIRKRCVRGKWGWQGFMRYTEDGKSRQVTKMLGIPCDPPTEDEKKQGKKVQPTGKGAAKAREVFKTWRSKLIDDEEQREIEELERVKREAEEALIPEAARLTVREYVERHIERIAPRNAEKADGQVEDSTASSYQYAAKHIGGPLDGVTMRDLSADKIDDWMEWLRDDEKLGASMQNKALRLLNKCCKNAVDKKHIDSNPCIGIKPVEITPPAPNSLDEDSYKRLNAVLDAMNHSDFADACKFALLTGLRQGEVCGLRWKDVSGWREGIFTRFTVCNVIGRGRGGLYNKVPKGKKGKRNTRTIDTNEAINEVLAARYYIMHQQCQESGVPFTGELYVFGKAVSPDAVGTGFMSTGYLSHQWTMLARMFDFRGEEGRVAVFHDLRHTFATHALKSGVQPKTVQTIMGHHTATMTMDVYANALPSQTKSAMELMGVAMSESSILSEADKSKLLPSGTEG